VCAGVAASGVPPPAPGDPGRVLRVPQTTARLLKLPRHPRLCRHTLLQGTAQDCRQIHATKLSRGKYGSYPSFYQLIRPQNNLICCMLNLGGDGILFELVMFFEYCELVLVNSSSKSEKISVRSKK
jgi:hypothetical protein